MRRSRFTRALALLVLILAQAGLSLPERAAAQGAMAQAMAAAGAMAMPAAHEDCQPGMAGDGMPAHAPAPLEGCGCCHNPVPGAPGSCVVMAGCGPTLAAPVAPALAVLTTVSTLDLLPAVSSPAAHDFIPDPPPPRA